MINNQVKDKSSSGNHATVLTRKPREKLSDRLTKLFLTNVKEFDIFYFDKLSRPKNDYDYNPLELAKKMSEHVMNMIAEYEQEDIE